WQPIRLERWEGKAEGAAAGGPAVKTDGGAILIKAEKMPDGKTKRIYKDPATGALSQTIDEA
ncbi:MAG: gfo/Idh/MocA family oxidoreductase, partial [Acidobacteriota bacterium]|nr:gfo/Idh/MocA family oxidoreductase [Acidobacteriota bacterium]